MPPFIWFDWSGKVSIFRFWEFDDSVIFDFHRVGSIYSYWFPGFRIEIDWDTTRQKIHYVGYFDIACTGYWQTDCWTFVKSLRCISVSVNFTGRRMRYFWNISWPPYANSRIPREDKPHGSRPNLSFFMNPGLSDSSTTVLCCQSVCLSNNGTSRYFESVVPNFGERFVMRTIPIPIILLCVRGVIRTYNKNVSAYLPQTCTS